MTSLNSLNSVFDIPILAYHKVSPESEFGLTTIRPENFRAQIEYLHSNGFTALTFRDLLKDNFNMPDKPVILTFDDGYESIDRYALPVLEQYGFRAVIFVVTGFIGKRNTWEAYRVQQRHRHLSAPQLKRMHQAGHEIGSHTVTHPYLSTLPAAAAASEIMTSRQMLEDLLGEQIVSFCYPYGRYSARIAGLLRENEYIFATVNRGILNRAKPNLLALPRASIYAIDTPSAFIRKTRTSAKPDLPRLTEYVIQTGALTGILKKSATQILSKDKDSL